MMISPGGFYDEVKDKSIEDVESEIRKLKRTITKLKDEIENPGSEPDMVCPSRETVIYWSREYLEMAKKALADAGGEYKETKEEKRASAFLERLPSLRRMELEIGGFFGGWEKYVIEVDGDTLTRDTVMVLRDLDEPEVETREALLEYLRDMHLEEWRKDYSPERYGMYILDGTQWSLILQYEDGKTREYEGDNVYPWNFGELCRLFGLEWNRYNEPA